MTTPGPPDIPAVGSRWRNHRSGQVCHVGTVNPHRQRSGTFMVCVVTEHSANWIVLDLFLERYSPLD